jgi:hypothetical protein
MEASRGPAEGLEKNVAAVIRVLESLGVEFTFENGRGVRLRNK